MRSFILATVFLASSVAAVDQLHFMGSSSISLTATVEDDAASAFATPNVLQEHYGSPAEGCQSDEMQFQISGVPGEICAPKCTGT